MKKSPNPAPAHHAITTARRPDNIRSSALVQGQSIQFMVCPSCEPQRPCPKQGVSLNIFADMHQGVGWLRVGEGYNFSLQNFVPRTHVLVQILVNFGGNLFYGRKFTRGERKSVDEKVCSKAQQHFRISQDESQSDGKIIDWSLMSYVFEDSKVTKGKNTTTQDR